MHEHFLAHIALVIAVTGQVPVDAAVTTVKREYSDADIVFNNAGLMLPGAFGQRHLRVELGPKNIRVPAIEQGISDTELQGHVTFQDAIDWLENAARRRICSSRPTSPRRSTASCRNPGTSICNGS